MKDARLNAQCEADQLTWRLLLATVFDTSVRNPVGNTALGST